jgi:hypothetical protein
MKIEEVHVELRLPQLLIEQISISHASTDDNYELVADKCKGRGY